MDLKPLFQPRNVAVIGASRTPGKHGNSAFRYVLRGGFPGGVFAVNAAAAGEQIEGHPCYGSIRDVPAPVDCALLVVPASAAVQTVRECAQSGVRSVVVASTGFAELGTDEGRARQSELLRAARAGSVRVLGPNTNGLYNATDRLCLGYNTSFGDPLNPGPVSIAAHSGALFNSVAPRLRQYGAGLSKFVPVGNEADLSMLDFVEFFIHDEATGVIALIIEGLTDGARFRGLAAQARAAGKPIVALKLGRSAAGAGAAMAHSSRLAGSARAYDALFCACGVASVSSVEAMAGACAVLMERRPAPRGNHRSLVCISTSGGGSSLLADHAQASGIPLAGGPGGEWRDGVAARIASLPGAGPIRNPIDIGSLGNQGQLDELLAAQEADGILGPAILFTHLLPNIRRSELLASQLIERKKRIASPLVVVSPGGLTDELIDRYRSAGIPVFSDIATCFESLRCIYTGMGDGDTGAEPIPDSGNSPFLDRAGEILRRTESLGREFLSEVESAEVLRCCGIAVVDSRELGSPAAVEAAGRDAGYPLVLKALAPDAPHKSRLGFVLTGIADAQALQSAYAELERRIAARGYARANVPIVLQRMLSSPVELIVGVSREAPLGHFLIAGLGGIYAEVLDEVLLLPIPVSTSAIRARLRESRLGRLLYAIDDGIVAELARVLLALQRLIAVHGERIRSIDVNPLLVAERGCVAVDALIVPEKRP